MSKQGLLLVNLGSPTAPTTKAVRQYLNDFLGDPNVIGMPPALWQPILKGFILPFRSWRSATFYRDVWTREGSPLIVNSQKLTKRVQELMPNWDVQLAMTYEQPAIKDVLGAMKGRGESVIVLPLFPHYTRSTTQPVIQQVHAVDPNAKIIDRFGNEAGYVKVVANNIEKAWQKKRYDRLIISYHGIPQSTVNHGDPYQKQTRQMTEQLKKALTIPDKQIIMAYQSKFGPAPWLKPYLNNTLLQQTQLGNRNILIAAPSFVTDCLETLEENSVQNYQSFRQQGGRELDVVPAPNDDPEFAQFIADLVEKQAK